MLRSTLTILTSMNTFSPLISMIYPTCFKGISQNRSGFMASILQCTKKWHFPAYSICPSFCLAQILINVTSPRFFYGYSKYPGHCQKMHIANNHCVSAIFILALECCCV
ncbi:hypothetical protein CHS0354_025863 [Potamilus streckersoni]|uniref:Uncharacterized protein n=1 Tax=Potamilus streckersoni TaxID=2493646 RepID=A0AAE0SBK5_9BIVA|nr:hypothetical protein CHS0354_025863 [Potamilus streckersoni]